MLRLDRVLAYRWRLATSPQRVLPDFLVIGAQKAGSTYVYRHLCRHPQVVPAVRKEVRFFERHYPLGLLWYRSNFPLRLSLSLRSRMGRKRYVTGEASPYYIFHPAVPKRVSQALPQAKVIALLRNPVDRAISGYYESHKKGYDNLSLSEALEAEEKRLEREEERLLDNPYYCSNAHFRFSYKARGVYVDQLLRWEQHFPRDQMLVLKSEAVFAEPERFFPRICRFLGLPEWAPRNLKKVNVGRYPQASQAVLERLHAYFEPHNQRLYQHLGEDWGWSL